MSLPIWIWMAMTALKIATAIATLTSTLITSPPRSMREVVDRSGRSGQCLEGAAADHHGHQRQYLEHHGHEQREHDRLADGLRRVLGLLGWEIVYADGKPNEFEANIIWRAADLLGVSSRQRVALRQLVLADNATVAQVSATSGASRSATLSY